MIDPTFWRRAGPALGLASTLTGSIVAGGLLGAGLDHLLGTRHLLTGLVAMLGLAAGMLQVVRVASKTLPGSPDDPPSRPGP